MHTYHDYSTSNHIHQECVCLHGISYGFRHFLLIIYVFLLLLQLTYWYAQWIKAQTRIIGNIYISQSQVIFWSNQNQPASFYVLNNLGRCLTCTPESNFVMWASWELYNIFPLQKYVPRDHTDIWKFITKCDMLRQKQMNFSLFFNTFPCNMDNNQTKMRSYSALKG